jgi:putative DNA-binding protein
VTLAETQALFHRLVTGAEAVPAGALEACFPGSDELPAAERLAVYRNMYAARLVDALRETFPNLARFLGEGRFAALGEDYVARHPSQHHDVGRVGRRLPAFLREYPDPERPDLADLAELEWARNEVCFAPGSEAAGAGALATLPGQSAATARLRLSPSLLVLALAYDAAGLWRMLERGEPPAPPVAGPRAVAIWRRGFEVFHCAVPRHEAAALRAALEGGTLGEVCAHFAERPDPAAEAHAALSGWFEEGWVAQVVPLAPGSG